MLDDSALQEQERALDLIEVTAFEFHDYAQTASVARHKSARQYSASDGLGHSGLFAGLPLLRVEVQATRLLTFNLVCDESNLCWSRGLTVLCLTLDHSHASAHVHQLNAVPLLSPVTFQPLPSRLVLSHPCGGLGNATAGH